MRRHAGNIDDSEGMSQGQRRIDHKGRPKTSWFTIPVKLPTTPEHEEEKWRPSQIGHPMKSAACWNCFRRDSANRRWPSKPD